MDKFTKLKSWENLIIRKKTNKKKNGQFSRILNQPKAELSNAQVDKRNMNMLSIIISSVVKVSGKISRSLKEQHLLSISDGQIQKSF